VVVGDKKTLIDWQYLSVEFLTLHSQSKLFSNFADALPVKHYGRKKLDCIYVFKEVAKHIFDIDDCNLPYPYWPSIRSQVSGLYAKNLVCASN
jgi:hypothetical protein